MNNELFVVIGAWWTDAKSEDWWAEDKLIGVFNDFEKAKSKCMQIAAYIKDPTPNLAVTGVGGGAVGIVSGMSQPEMFKFLTIYKVSANEVYADDQKLSVWGYDTETDEEHCYNGFDLLNKKIS